MSKGLVDKIVLEGLSRITEQIELVNERIKQLGFKYHFELIALNENITPGDDVIKDKTTLPDETQEIEQLYKKLVQIQCDKNKYTLIVLDVIEFKQINYMLGYGSGNILIEKITQFLEMLGLEIYKYNIDKFVVVGKKSSLQESIKIIHEIKKRFLKSWDINNGSYQCAVKVGIINYNELGKNVEAFIKKIDYSFVYLKANGKEEFSIINEFDYEKYIRKEIIHEVLRKAIRDKTLKVHYQPIYDIKQDKTIKLEALARLEDTEIGDISPLEFIDIAEEKGLIHELGDLIVEKVCEQIKYLERQNIKFERISINVSATQFSHKTFIERIKNILCENEVCPTRIEFELTESVFIQSMERVVEIMNEMSKMGIIFSLDDFGTGYSSLGYLAKLPVNAIKIDKRFVDDIENEHFSLVLLKNIIQMGKELGVTTVAEGVETKEQYNILNQLKCSAIQGYLLSKPLPADEVINVFEVNL